MPYLINLLSNLIKYTICLTENCTCIHSGGLTPLLASLCAQGTPAPACGGKLIPPLASKILLLLQKTEDEFQTLGQSWQKPECSQPGQDFWKDSATCSSYWEKLAIITKTNKQQNMLHRSRFSEIYWASYMKVKCTDRQLQVSEQSYRNSVLAPGCAGGPQCWPPACLLTSRDHPATCELAVSLSVSADEPPEESPGYFSHLWSFLHSPGNLFWKTQPRS